MAPSIKSRSRPRSALHTCLILLIGLLFTAAPARAGEPIVLEPHFGHADISSRLEILRDPAHALTLDEVTGPAARFAPATEAVPNLGFTKDAIWTRFTVKNASPQPIEWYLELGNNLYEYLDIYRLVQGEAPALRRSGQLAPFATRDMAHRHFVFKEKIPAGGAATYLVRTVSDKSIDLHYTGWSPAAFAEHAATEYASFGLYFGIMAVMLAYNLFLTFALREKTYFYYVVYVFFVAATMFAYDGFGFQFIWTGNLWFEERSVTFFYCIAYFFGMHFSRVFLDTPLNAPRLDRLFKGLMASAVVILLLGLFVSHRWAPPLINLLSIFLALLLGAGFMIVAKGYRPARYFVLAWTAFLAGLAVLAFKHFALLPANFATEWSFQIGSAMEVVLLSLALGDRINIMREEKEAAQARALEQEKIAQQALRRSKEELEQLVAERTAELAESESRFRQLSNASFEGVLIHNNGTILDANDQAADMLGYPTHELLGKNLDALLDLSGIDLSLAPMGEPIEITGRRSDGATFPAEIRLQRTHFRGRNAVVAALRDISGRKKIETDLRNAKETAESATRLKDKFISLISHDLRSPLSSLMGALTIVERGIAGAVPAETAKLMGKMSDNVHGMLNMLDKLLDLSRLQSGNLELKAAPFNARRSAQAVLDKLEVLAAQKGVALANELPPGARLVADPSLFEEALQNLLTNGIKFSHRGGRVTVFEPDGAGTLAVRDEGTGMTKETLHSLFNSAGGVTSLGTSGERGTGLGLPFCRDIMSAHGGRIWAASATGKGSTFYLAFPPQPVTVLLADTDRAFIELARARLAAAGLRVLDAATGGEALEMLHREEVHLLVTSLQLPGLSGLKVIDMLRTGERTRALPVIAITGAADAAARRSEALEIGANDFIMQPFSIDDLVLRVRRFLG